MEFIKHNINWDAEPNAPMPNVDVCDQHSKIRLSFYLNAFIHKDVNEEDIGIIEFEDCYKYRIGPTNDEGFYNGKCRFSKTGVKWGNFYQVNDSDWEDNFPNDEIILNKSLKDSESLNHYLFYFRDETFECISKSFNFTIIRESN